jgi:D-alanyl-D-alanine endopeptidase (penicillin-binding protein 7)
VELIANWLWQGSVVALAASVVLRAVTGLTAQARYRVYGAALLAVMALPLLSVIPARMSPVRESASAAPALGASVALPDAWWTSNTIVVIAVAIWAAVLSVRVALDVFALRRARRECRAFPIARASRLRHWARATEGGRAAPLMTSGHVGAAAVLSGRPPLIAVARPLLDRLTDRELDCVVIHEWAHVQRRDDVANALQVAARTVAGWHPAVWWLDRRLQAEREPACDEMAAALTGSTAAYAACLLKLHELRRADAPLPALGVSSSSLTPRIERLLSRKRPSRWSRHVAMVLIALVATVSFAAGSLDLVDRIALRPVEDARPMPSAVPVAEAAAETPPPVLRTPPPRRPALKLIVLTQGLAGTGASAADAAPAHPSSPIAPESFHAAPLEAISRADRAANSFETPTPPPVTRVVAAPAAAVPPSAEASSTPWGAAADAGTAIGRGSKKASLATAAFFTRMGKGIASTVSNDSDARSSR